jgi:integrase
VDLEQGVIYIRRSVFEGAENTTKSEGGDEDRAREVPIDASVMGELRRHLNRRRFGYVFQTNRGTPLRLSNVLEDVLHPTLKKLNIPNAGMHAFRHGRCSHLVYTGARRAVIRDWLGHSSDAMVDHYTAKLRSHHAQEMAKVKSVLDSELDSTLRKESGAQAA